MLKHWKQLSSYCYSTCHIIMTYTISSWFQVSSIWSIRLFPIQFSSEIEQKSIALIDHFPRRDMLSTTSNVTFCIKNRDLARRWYFSYQFQYVLWCLHSCVVKRFIWILYKYLKGLKNEWMWTANGMENVTSEE